MSDKKEFKVNGSGVLSYANIESVCSHGSKSDLETVLAKAQYAQEKAQEKVDKMSHGFDLIGLDYKGLTTDLEALLEVEATDKQIKKVIGAKYKTIKKYRAEVNKLDYYDNMVEKIEKAMG